MVIPVSALTIYDSSGNPIGTSVLTSSSGGRIYTLKVTDTTGGANAYGRIYLYKANGNTIDGGWDTGSYVELTKGNSSISPVYRSIWSSVNGYRYTYYDEY